MNRYIIAALSAIAIGLTACGGGDDPPNIAASYTQTAPAGVLTVAAGQTEATTSLVLVEHQVGSKLTRITVTGEVVNARNTGATSASVRWVLREGSTVIAQGQLSAAPTAGAGGTTSHEVNVTGGAHVSAEIIGVVAGPAGSSLRWDSAKLSLSAAPL